MIASGCAVVVVLLARQMSLLAHYARRVLPGLVIHTRGSPTMERLLRGAVLSTALNVGLQLETYGPLENR